MTDISGIKNGNTNFHSIAPRTSSGKDEQTDISIEDAIVLRGKGESGEEIQAMPLITVSAHPEETEKKDDQITEENTCNLSKARRTSADTGHYTAIAPDIRAPIITKDLPGLRGGTSEVTESIYIIRDPYDNRNSDD
jgi:hypothetical protein